MQYSKINRVETNLFSTISNELSYNQQALSAYIDAPFSLQNFREQLTKKTQNYSDKNRHLLHEVLVRKYTGIESDDKVKENIENLLNSNTFTVTTGHQLSLFTGPIYVIYKILHVIKLCKELKKEYPDYNFVPVYWMASEDHDFEEIKSISLFNQTLAWNTDQTGPVGRFDFSTMDELKAQFLSFFDTSEFKEVQEVIEAYQGTNLGEANFKLIHKLFESFGLLIVDGDDCDLKKAFLPIVYKEIEESFSYHAVTLTNLLLEKEHIKQQVHAREINLFYCEKGIRERLKLVDGKVEIAGVGTFTKEEIKALAQANPEKISPNVILRPVYQEVLLPNLCYVGGGGEMSYWLQLKGGFDAIGLTYPLIQVRNSLLHIDAVSRKRIDNLNLSLTDLFLPIDALKKKFVLGQGAENLNFEGLKQVVTTFESELKSTVEKVENGLESYAAAEVARFEKQIESIVQKLIKTEKNKHEQSLKQMDQLKEKLFPGGGMQERSMNFFQLCANGRVYENLELIYQVIDPFENDLLIYEFV